MPVGHIDSCTFISRYKVRVYECSLQINRPRSETDRFASGSSDDRHRRVKGPVQRDAARPQTVDNRRPLIAGPLGPVSRVNGTQPDVLADRPIRSFLHCACDFFFHATIWHDKSPNFRLSNCNVYTVFVLCRLRVFELFDDCFAV